jgi:trimeric autotransporter adhesin
MCKKLFFASFLFFISYVSKGQSLAINTDGSTANASALLDIKSTGKGVLIPRMSKVQKNAIATPATGLLIFQDAPDSTGFYYYDGTAWLWLATTTNAVDWRTSGNGGTDTAVNFIGTTDNMPIRFKQNNNWVGQLNSNNSNFFIGTNSGKNTTAGTNTAFGANSLASNNIGMGNLGMGAAAMSFNTSASRNTGVGDSAMFTQSFSNGGIAYFTDNTAIGAKALFFNQPTTNSNGYKNTAVGSEALYLNTTGFENTAVGTGAMHDNITGQQSTALGRSANRLAKSGSSNTYLGFESGYNDSLSSFNTGIGSQSLRLFGAATGQNVAIGYNTGNDLTTGSNNVLVGFAAGDNLANGTDNTFVGGLITAPSPYTGNQNTLIGARTIHSNAGITNATAIGYRAAVIQSNSLILGSINGINGATANCSVGIGTTAPTARLDVAANFKLGNVGTINTSMIRTAVIVDVPNIAANNELDVLVTVANISTSAPVAVTPNGDIEAGISISWARISALNTVKIRFRNNTGADINPGSQTYHFLIVQ